MACLEFSDLLALVAANAATAGERARVERHIESCPDCRHEYDQLADMVNRLDSNTPELSALERLELENQILRSALEVGERVSARTLSPWHTVLRIAATLLIFGLGYLTYPLIGRAPEHPASPALKTMAPATSAQVRKALNSGLRFSGAGLRAITLGQHAMAAELRGQ